MASIEIHPLLADRSRLLIMAAIATSDGAVDFSTLHSTLELTKGNLSSHLRKLEDEKLILIQKEFVNRVPRTTYRCSARGRAAIRSYLESVESLLRKV